MASDEAQWRAERLWNRLSAHASRPLHEEDARPEVNLRGPLINTSNAAEAQPMPPAPPLPPSAPESPLPAPEPTPAQVSTGDPPAPPGSSQPPEVVAQIQAESIYIPLTEASRAENLQRQQEWQEERIQRKLQHNYERITRNMAQTIKSNLDAPVRLDQIRSSPTVFTRTSFLNRIFNPYIASLTPPPPTASTSDLHYAAADDPPSVTLGNVYEASQKLTRQLLQYGIFDEVEASIEPAHSIFANPGDVDLFFRLKEAGRYYLKTSTEVGNNEGSANVTGRIRNVFGGGENAELTMAAGNLTRSAYQLSFDTPVLASPTTRFDVSLFKADKDSTAFASCKERITGGQLRLKGLSPFGYHELAYGVVDRHIADLDRTASLSMRLNAGHTTKSSLTNTFIRESRDDPFLPTSGSYLKSYQEYAGLGGDANHLKGEVEGQKVWSLGGGFSLSMGLKSGMLYPLKDKTLFSDRFHLGGPTSIRSFKVNGLGPKDNDDYLGGDVYWASGLSLITPIPWRRDWPVRGHFFANGGKLISYNKKRPFDHTMEKLTEQPSTAVGLGLLCRFGGFRLELNFGLPISAAKSDATRQGLQFGVGLGFLS